MATIQPQGNPPTREILKNHELASRTINQHGTDLAIFDDNELDILRSFVADPTPSNRDALLQSHDMLDGPDDEPGARAHSKGSLAGYVVSRWGRSDGGTLNDDEIKDLHQWFSAGGGK